MCTERNKRRHTFIRSRSLTHRHKKRAYIQSSIHESGMNGWNWKHRKRQKTTTTTAYTHKTAAAFLFCRSGRWEAQSASSEWASEEIERKKRDTHEANREEKGVQGACIRGFVYYTYSNWNRIEDASVNAFRFISALLFLLRSLFVFHTRGPIWCVFEMHCNTMDVAGYFRHCLISLAHHVTLCAQEKKANAIDNLFV